MDRVEIETALLTSETYNVLPGNDTQNEQTEKTKTSVTSLNR